MRPDPAPLSRAQRLALTVTSFVFLVVATMALGPLISGSGWWWLCAFVAAGTMFGGFGLRAMRTPPSLVPVLELVVVLLLLTLLFGGATSIALVVPTTGTFDTFDELLSGAQRTIEQQSVPAIPVPPLTFACAVKRELEAGSARKYESSPFPSPSASPQTASLLESRDHEADGVGLAPIGPNAFCATATIASTSA